jgi:hypothetical protein
MKPFEDQRLYRIESDRDVYEKIRRYFQFSWQDATGTILVYCFETGPLLRKGR